VNHTTMRQPLVVYSMHFCTTLIARQIRRAIWSHLTAAVKRDKVYQRTCNWCRWHGASFLSWQRQQPLELPNFSQMRFV